jgi:putative spermidine/putrescine transport system ATP-binding protein
MSRVRLIDVSKRYGPTVAVDRVSADIGEGEFVTLLGPSGCGKTTTLRMIAGLIEPSDGQIFFDEQLVNDLPPQRRNIGFVFQSHALFPHLSVADNVAFGLAVKRRPKAEIQSRVAEMLELVELAGYGERLPAQLSGGQQQRVALARVLATDPRVLLFDEPLSALDRNLRDTLKYSILELQRRTRKTAVYVTHDQSEAFAISDRIFVMNGGRVEQSGTQIEIYTRPQSEFVANFVGDNNVLRGSVVATHEDGGRQVTVASGALRPRARDTQNLQVGEAALVFVRPEHIEVLDAPAEGEDVVAGAVAQIVFEGATVRLTVDVDGTPLKVSVGGTRRLTLLGSARERLWLRLRDPVVIRDQSVST